MQKFNQHVKSISFLILKERKVSFVYLSIRKRNFPSYFCEFCIVWWMRGKHSSSNFCYKQNSMPFQKNVSTRLSCTNLKFYTIFLLSYFDLFHHIKCLLLKKGQNVEVQVFLTFIKNLQFLSDCAQNVCNWCTHWRSKTESLSEIRQKLWILYQWWRNSALTYLYLSFS